MIRTNFQIKILASVHHHLFIIAYQSGITATNLLCNTFKMIISTKKGYIIHRVYFFFTVPRLVLNQKHQEIRRNVS